MWRTLTTSISPAITGYYLLGDGERLSFQEVIDLWERNPAFRQFFTQTLQNSRYKAFFWEVKPITSKSLEEAFEFVLVNSSMLPTIKASPRAFQTHFQPGESVVSFPNLSGDAHLIVPTAIADPSLYGHLASFLRNAPTSQIDRFWQVVATEYRRLIGEQPRWLSTAGLGVPWLHVRVDTRPKYYRYQGYKR